MLKRDAIEKYGNIVVGYVDADRYCWINLGDKDLHPIRICLPEPPDWEKIEGFGLPAKDQVFTRESYPVKLKQLERNVREESKALNKSPGFKESWINEEIPQRLLQQRAKFRDEIEWIREQWYYRLNGKWFFINGKPTYFNNWLWFYLNYCKMNGVLTNDGLPDYRDRDRRWFTAVKYAATTTETPEMTYEYKGNNTKLWKPIYNTDGSIKTKDVGYRVCYGVNSLKGRRVGETSKALCIALCEATEGKERHIGIQDNKESTTKDSYNDKLLYPYLKLPFFFKPKTKGYTYTGGIHFNDGTEDSLGSWIDYATTSSKNFYDGQKLYCYISSEAGKTEMEDINIRHEVVRECVAPGGQINGIIIYTTTVDEMDRNTGQKFLQLTKGSHFENRNENGSTASGLFNIFFPAWDGREGYIGRYGESIVDYATEDQIPYLTKKAYDDKGRVLGARKFMERERDALIRDKDHTRLIEAKRKHPFTYSDCFTPPAKNAYFNLKIIEERIEDLRRNPKSIRGNFIKESGEHGRVIFIEDEDYGRFNVSHQLPENMRSLKARINGEWFPQHPGKFVASADPFRFEKTDGGKQSDGAGAVRWMRDYVIDPENTDRNNMQTDCLVCTYSNRNVTEEEYCQDMLNMCIYYGALMYPENNINMINKYFIDTGYNGYLLYNIDPETGQKKNRAGFNSSGLGGLKATMFNKVRNEVHVNGTRCNHSDWLEQCLAIRGIDDTTNYDLFIAVAGTLLAQESSYNEEMKLLDNTIDMTAIWKSVM